MNNFEELVSKKIGKTIKRERLNQNISQKNQTKNSRNTKKPQQKQIQNKN